MCTLITILYMSSGSLGLKYKQIIGNEYLLYCVVFNILFLFISVILLHSIQGILQPEVRTEHREHKYTVCTFFPPPPCLSTYLQLPLFVYLPMLSIVKTGQQRGGNDPCLYPESKYGQRGKGKGRRFHCLSCVLVNQPTDGSSSIIYIGLLGPESFPLLCQCELQSMLENVHPRIFNAMTTFPFFSFSIKGAQQKENLAATVPCLTDTGHVMWIWN